MLGHSRAGSMGHSKIRMSTRELQPTHTSCGRVVRSLDRRHILAGSLDTSSKLVTGS